MKSLAREIGQCIEELESTNQRIEIAHISVVELKNWQARATALEQQPECGCCGQTDRCDDDCDAVVIGGHRTVEQKPDNTQLVEAAWKEPRW